MTCTELLALAQDMAEPCAYYDYLDIPDGGDISKSIVKVAAQHQQYSIAEPISLHMLTFSTPLGSKRLPTIRANRMARSTLLRAYMRQPPGYVGGIFGKTLWSYGCNCGSVPSFSDNYLKIPQLDQVSDILEPTDYIHVDHFHLRGWVAAVASALKRRSPELHGSDSREVVMKGVAQVRAADWDRRDQAHMALSTLKAFTQPTWWTTKTPSNNTRYGFDLHFPSLLNERQYRHDISAVDTKNLILAVTDIPSFFLGSAYKVGDLIRAARGGPLSRMGIAGRVLRAFSTGQEKSETLLPRVFEERLNAAQELARTLQDIGEYVTDLGGRTYATHGDGVSIIMPRRAWSALLVQLNNSSIPLPVALGGVSIDRATRDVEQAAEMALLNAKASMNVGSQWIEGCLDHGMSTDIQRGLDTWNRLAVSNDAVENWIGLKGLRSIAVSSS